MLRRPAAPRLDLEAIKFALLALGLLALLVGVAMYLIVSDLTIPVRAAIALGIVLLGAYVAIDPEDAWRRISGRGTLYSSNTLVMAVAGLGILGLINVLAAQPSVHKRFDLTANQQFSLSDQSLTIARELPQPVKATGFFVQQDRTQQENAETLLKQYQTASGGKLTYEFIDPEQRPSLAQQFNVRQSGTVVFQMGDARQNATTVDEQDFTSALIKLVHPTPRKVYFVTGHGERSTTDASEAGYTTIVDQLKKENFTVDNLNLTASRQVPDDASAVVIAAPTKEFLPDEKKAIQDYLDRGGSLLLMIETTTTPQVADYLAPWNVKVDFHPIIDPASSVPQDAGALIIDRYIFHAITKNMALQTLFPGTAALIFPKDQAQGVFTAPLAESSQRSWIEEDDQEIKDGRVRFDAGQDPQGPITVAGVIEADAKQQPPADPNNPDRPPKKTRVFVVADADFVSNQFVRLPTGNADLFLNALNWLSESEQLISIRAKDQDVRQIVLTGTAANTMFWTSTVFLPLLVLGAGAFVWWTRR